MKKIISLVLLLVFNIVHAQISNFKTIDFTKADNIAKLNKGESLKNLPLLCYKLTFKLETKVEKLRAIYTWVSTNVKGDYNMHREVARKRKELKKDSLALNKWNRIYKKTVFKKLMNRKKTMCTGYAYLIKEMANIVDIECKIIDGYGRTVTSNIDTLETLNHSWNAVKLNNKWYVCDATWSSGYMDENGAFITDYNTGYFLTDPELFSKNHYPLDKKWLLKSAQTNATFVNAPIVYGEIFKHKITTLLPKKMKIDATKKEVINFELKSLKNISLKKVSLVYFFGNNENKLKIYDIKNEYEVIRFRYKFKWKGHYDVHLKVDDDIIATYLVNVTN